jgi:3-deoxy-D-manno-octulosonate 8-phosphate phosphatase KdsC-like HAD superfamily phosphatase
MCPILDGYGVMTAWNLELKVTIIDNKRNKIINQQIGRASCRERVW